MVDSRVAVRDSMTDVRKVEKLGFGRAGSTVGGKVVQKVAKLVVYWADM